MKVNMENLQPTWKLPPDAGLFLDKDFFRRSFTWTAEECHNFPWPGKGTTNQEVNISESFFVSDKRRLYINDTQVS